MQARFTPVNLESHANQKLNEPFHGNSKGNDLAVLPVGKQTFAGIPFTVGKGAIQLGGGPLAAKPQKVEGIKVGLSATRLHFLHSCGFGSAVPGDTPIGKYVVHYADRTSAEVTIVYGRDVVDWWVRDGKN